MLRTLLLLVTVLAALTIWLIIPLGIFDILVMFMMGLWLWLRFVTRGLKNRPSWAHRSLLNYVKILVARYSPLRTNVFNFRMV